MVAGRRLRTADRMTDQTFMIDFLFLSGDPPLIPIISFRGACTLIYVNQIEDFAVQKTAATQVQVQKVGRNRSGRAQ